MKRKWKVFLALTIIIAFIVQSSAVFAGTTYKTYVNNRFGYFVLYPHFFKQYGALPANNDGITMRSKKAELRIWGSYNALSQTPQQYYQMASRNENVYYKKITKDSMRFYAKLGKGKKTFQYAYFVKNGMICFKFTYPTSQHKSYKKIISYMIKNVRINKSVR